MFSFNRKIALVSMLFTSIQLASCASFNPPDSSTDLLESRATEPTVSKTNAELVSLPEPLGIITAAVYAFKDQTGQYKPSPSNNLSTAVSQGADTILVKALLDSGWFLPVERSGLQNLLTERKIVQTSHIDANANAIPTLPAVAPAQIIIEGSVVAYDFNIRSGGAGAKILGIGTSQSYREDLITVNLRAVNIQNGLILHSVNSTKRIFSRQLNSGIFSYIDIDKILEVEAGYSYNEPGQLAITEAIESALIHLIAEGITLNSWQLKNYTELNNDSFGKYIARAKIDNYIALNAKLNEQRKREKQQKQYQRQQQLQQQQQEQRRPQQEHEHQRQNLPSQSRINNQSDGKSNNKQASNASQLVDANSQSPDINTTEKMAPEAEISTHQISQNPASISPMMFLVGEYQSLTHAELVKKNLVVIPKNVDIQIINNPGTSVYSLHIGPVRTEVEANQVTDALRSIGVEQVKVLRLPG